MQVLRVTVKLRPGTHAFSANGWWSGWVLCRGSLIFDTSPSCKVWVGKPVSAFMHWAQCAGGEKCWKSNFEEQDNGSASSASVRANRGRASED